MNSTPTMTSHPPSTSLLDLAFFYRNAGLSVVPAKADGSKRPDLAKWKEFMNRLPTDAELRDWFGNDAKVGIGFVTGSVSGNLEVLDFDSGEAWEQWKKLVEATAPGTLESIPRVRTPSGGIHLYLRRKHAVPGNRKLARSSDGHTLIETRGEGGFVLAPGSPPECHPQGKTYEWERPLNAG